jgi:hypothetical protein
MKGRLSVGMLSLGVTLAFGLLALFSSAHAIDTWSSPFSFTVNRTFIDSDPSGNEKFLTTKQTFAGTLKMYIDEDGLHKNGYCFLTFDGDDGTIICIKELAGISTESPKSLSEKLLLVGVGTLYIIIGDTQLTGVAYVDLKGTLKQDKNGHLASFALSGKIGGGANTVNNDFVFNATLNNTNMTK